ncbi:hypothetical protein [Saccharothrix lopnurensis]|uniref:Uncharacterized protein n=1 Tax=Saccharothrix lopnurensis TaxID=1670621 RepID=A0ABW1P816_9PSEU
MPRAAALTLLAYDVRVPYPGGLRSPTGAADLALLVPARAGSVRVPEPVAAHAFPDSRALPGVGDIAHVGHTVGVLTEADPLRPIVQAAPDAAARPPTASGTIPGSCSIPGAGPRRSSDPT